MANQISSEQDMTISQGGGGGEPPPAENPFANFKNDVSTDEQNRIDAAKATAPPAETAKPADEEIVDDTPAAGEEAAAETPAEKGGKSKFQQRIDQMRRTTTDAEERATRAEAALAEERRTKKTATPPSTSDTKSWKNDPSAPKAEDFPYGEVDPDFIVALADWRFEQRSAQQAEENKTASARSAAEAEVSKVNAAWETRAEAAAEKLPDFVDVVYKVVDGKPAWPASAEMSRLIKTSPVGPLVAYHLAKNVKLARDIVAMPVVQQAVEFGRLEAKLTPKAAVTTPAGGLPPPPKDTASGRGGTPPSASSSSDFAAFERQVKAQTAAKHAGR